MAVYGGILFVKSHVFSTFAPPLIIVENCYITKVKIKKIWAKTIPYIPYKVKDIFS